MKQEDVDHIRTSLDSLLGHRDEIQNAVRKLFNQQQAHEARTTTQIEKFGEMFKGVHARITMLEIDGPKDYVLRGARSLLLVALGATTAWLLHK